MELQSRLEDLRAQGLGVVAISYDSQEVLADFARRRGITFPLLSDDDSSVITAFGILNTVAAEGVGPNRDDPDVVADVGKYVSVFGANPMIVGTPFPGHLHARCEGSRHLAILRGVLPGAEHDIQRDVEAWRGSLPDCRSKTSPTGSAGSYATGSSREPSRAHDV